MSRSSRIAPTPRALAIFAGALPLALLPALVSGALWPAWAAAIVVFAVVVAVDAARCPWARDVAVEMAPPPRLHVGKGGVLTSWPSAPLTRPVAAEATLDLGSGLAPIEPLPFRLARVPAELALPLRPLRRGPTRIEALWLRYGGPLGLVRRTVRIELDHRLDVLPDVPGVRAAVLRGLGYRDAWTGSKTERFAGDGTEFFALREFVAGLDPRSIDWKASARHARLLARETRAERNHPIVLALDTGRLMAEPLDGAPLLDHAIHAALELAWVGLRGGDRVGLLGFDQRLHTWAPPRGGRRTLPGLVELAGGLRYSRAETNFTLALTELSLRLHRRTLVIVLTDFVDSITAELMVDNLLRLARRHLTVFVAFRDPLLDALIERPPDTLEHLCRTTVADALALERETVLGRLRRAGILVIDAPPRAVGARLVDRYLEIKRREMIG